ncbi:MAG TPA: hypothetical protein VD995_01630 [Azospirillum sp.]|nr:hypothetical protein [Azospirillum sp.]
MSGIFSILGDSQAGMFRMRQAGKAFEKANEALFQKTDDKYRKDLGPASLADKAEAEQMKSRLAAERLRDAHSAMAAMEEAQRINNPKAAAEERLRKAERRIQELRQEARLAAARGDREKLAQLAREATQLAREAGKAAKEFSLGVTAAAAAGKGATTGNAIEITRETTVTTVTIATVETSVELRVGLGSGEASQAVAADSAAVPAAPAETLPAPSPSAGAAGAPADGDAPAGDATEDVVPREMLDLAQSLMGLAQSGALPTAATGDKAQQLVQKMFADGEAKMSRYKEADAFARRIERVIAIAKNVLTEAKSANELETDEARKKERREGFKEDEKTLDAAREEVQDLRAAAMDSGITPDDIAGALLDTTVGADTTVAAVDPGAVQPTLNVTA